MVFSSAFKDEARQIIIEKIRAEVNFIIILRFSYIFLSFKDSFVKTVLLYYNKKRIISKLAVI